MELTSPAKDRYWLLLLLGLSGIVFLFGLGRLALFGPDEPRYSEVAREMFVTGDYISPRLCGCLWFEKPVLMYWLMAGAYGLFGVSEFSARFPSALAAIWAAMLVYLCLRRSVSFEVGACSAVVLVTSGLFIGFGRAAGPDMVLTTAIAVSLLAAHGYLRSAGRRRWVLLLVSAIAAALSALTKGVVGPVLILAVLSIFVAVTGDWRTIRPRELILAFAAFAMITSIWYVPVITRHGWAFIQEFLIDHHINRYVSNRFSHPQPVYFFPLVAIAGLIPWSFFLIPAIARLPRLRPRSDKIDSFLLLSWIWVIVPILFFSVSQSKLPGYILPIFPAAAGIIGYELSLTFKGGNDRRRRIAVWGTAALIVAIGGAFTIYLSIESIHLGGWTRLLHWLPIAVAVIGFVGLALDRLKSLHVWVPVFVSSIVIGAVILVFPFLNQRETLKQLSLEVASALKPGELIAFFVKKEYAPVFYAEGRVLCGIEDGDVLNALSPELLVEALEIYPSLIVITTGVWKDHLKKDQRFSSELIGTQGEVAAFRLRLRPSDSTLMPSPSRPVAE